jgi:hypothetical protein
MSCRDCGHSFENHTILNNNEMVCNYINKGTHGEYQSRCNKICTYMVLGPHGEIWDINK